MPQHKPGKKGRKIGRHARKPCGGARQWARTNRNRVRKLTKHLRKHPNDQQAWDRLKEANRGRYLQLKQERSDELNPAKA